MNPQLLIALFSPLITAILLAVGKLVNDVRKGQDRIESKLNRLSESVDGHDRSISSHAQRISYLEGMALVAFRAGEKSNEQ